MKVAPNTETKQILLSIYFIWLGLSLQAQDTPKQVSAFKDSTDRAFDVSDFLLKKDGFLLVPALITEPAIGYGAAVAAIYFHSSYSEKHGPPSMSGLVGAATENGTWVGGALHVGYWKHDRLRYMGAAAKTNINVGYYGALTDVLNGEGLNLNMNAWLFLQQLKGRLGESDFFIGGKYILYETNNTFEIPVNLPDYNSIELKSVLSEATLIANYDSRNNVFSPSRGFFIDLSGTYSDNWFGGDGLYGRLGVDVLSYLPVNKKLQANMRIESNYTFGDIPYYARPMIHLRGVPLMKYQNNHTTVFEGEVEWTIYKRYSLIGFTGIGTAYSSIGEIDKGKSVRNMGTGFRYLLARKFGAKMGVDFAFTPDDFAFYIVFGTAWLR